MDRDAVLLAIGKLIASLHVPRSIPGGLHPTTLAAYDEVRNGIHDFGWSSPEEIAKRITQAIEEEGPSA